MNVNELVSRLESALEEAKAEKQSTYSEYADAPGGVNKYPAKVKLSNACRNVRELMVTLQVLKRFNACTQKSSDRLAVEITGALNRADLLAHQPYRGAASEKTMKQAADIVAKTLTE